MRLTWASNTCLKNDRQCNTYAQDPGQSIGCQSFHTRHSLMSHESMIACQSPFVLTPVRVLVLWKHLSSGNQRLDQIQMACWLNRLNVCRQPLTFQPCTPCLSRISFCSSMAGAWLTANIIKPCGLSLCGEEWKVYCIVQSSSLAISNYFVMCKCSLHWNISISSLHSCCPHQKPTSTHSRPCHLCNAGDSFRL